MMPNLARNSTYCTSDWWSCCFSLLTAALAHQYILHAGCACCAVSSWSQPWWSISSSLVLEVDWGHVSSFTGISGKWVGCSFTAALTSIREGFFFSQHNTGDASGSIGTTRYTETHLGSSPCNHGNRRILLVGSSQWWGISHSAPSNNRAACSPAHLELTLMG